MATVFRARQHSLRRLVAVKFLSTTETEARQRFLREARSLADLEHPNIVRLFAADAAGDVPYLVMELVEGGTLKELLVDGPLTPARLTGFARQAADALAYLHARGLVHRDVKPANILITKDGRVKLADFGLARFTAPGQTLTAEGHMVGTPHYIAPEILRYQRACPASDVYALGLVMHQALAGAFPFPAHEMRQLLVAHLELVPPDLGPLIPETASGLAPLIRRMLAKEPEQRPADGAALAEELDRIYSITGWERPARPRASSPPDASPPAARPAASRASSSRLPAARAPVSRSASSAPGSSRSWAELPLATRAAMATAAFVAMGLLAFLAVHLPRRPPPEPVASAPLASTPASPAPVASASASPLTTPDPLFLEPLVIRIPATNRKIPLTPVAHFTSLPADELATVADLSDQLRHSTVSSAMTVFIATNPLIVEMGLVEPPTGSAAFTLDLHRTAHPALRILVARRDALPIALTPSANRRRFFAERVPVRRGLNKIFLVFLQETGALEPVYVDALTVSLPAPGFAPPPADPNGAPLTPAAEALASELEAARRAERWDDVAALGEKLTKLAPQDGRGWWLKGDAHRRLFKPETRCGLEVLDEALRRMPQNPWVWHDLGCAFLCDGWFPEAVSFLAYATRLAPDEAWNWYDLGNALWHQKRAGEALACLARADRCAGAPRGVIARLSASILVARKDRPGALAALGKALAADPSDAETRETLARLQRGDDLNRNERRGP